MLPMVLSPDSSRGDGGDAGGYRSGFGTIRISGKAEKGNRMQLARDVTM